MSQQSNQHLEIVPSNVTSNGKLSFRNGQPVIQFIIGEQERYLLGSSLRLQGNFTIQNSSGALGKDNTLLSWDGRTSLYSTIDQVVIKSQATNQTIEHIRNYNRFMASYLATTNDLGDGLSHLNESALQSLNPLAAKLQVVDNAYNITSSPQPFCINLPCGLFNGTGPIPLSRQWGLGGLLLEIHLSPDSNVLFDTSGAGTTVQNAFYEYKNMSLICEVQTPAPSDLAKLQSSGGSGNTFEYNSVSSYYTTFNSTNAIINFQLGLSRVLSVFCNFITSAHINNRTANGMTTYYPMKSPGDTVATIKQVVFTRGGERLPLEYNIDTVQRTEPLNRHPDAQIYRNFVNAIQAFPKNTRNCINMDNMLMLDKTDVLGYNNFIDGGAAVGVGVAFDTISNQGIDFRTTSFGLNMDLDQTTNNPCSVYMFVHSKQTLVFNPQGIQIIQ